MKVLLVQSYLGGGESQVFPLGLSYLASSLKDHTVRVFDPNVSTDPYGELAKIIRDFHPDVTGISLRNIDSTNKRKVVFYYQTFKEMLAFARAEGVSTVVVGGSGFSMFAQQIMEDEPGIDLGVYLEGETTFPALLAMLDMPEKVPGVFYRREGKVVFSGPAEKKSMRDVPMPDRTSVSLTPYAGLPDGVGVETKRGCELGCIYCIYGFLNGKKNRLRPPETVVDEIESLCREHGLKRFTFVDSIFNHPLAHAEAICREMARRRLPIAWSAWFNERYLTEEFVRLVVDAGCDKIILSPDGFSDESLKLLGKNFRKRDILNAYEILKKFTNVEVCFNFFKNPPGQTLGAFVEMVRFYFKAKREMGQRVHFELNSMRVEPHTKLYDIALKEHQISETDNLLEPKYYTNSGTRYIELFFNAMLRLKGK